MSSPIPFCLTCPVLNFCKSGKKGDPENFPNLQKKKNKKKSIRRHWIESQGELLLFADLHSKKKLSGIYELPFELPESITYDPKAHEPIGIRKRTIGNADYQRKLSELQILNPIMMKSKMDISGQTGKKSNNLPYPAPTENGSKKFFADRGNA